MALRGTMHTLMSQVKEAIDDLTQVIDMDDDKASTKLKINCLIKRGSLHIQETREVEADQDFKKAILLDPNNSDIYHHRAQSYHIMVVMCTTTYTYHGHNRKCYKSKDNLRKPVKNLTPQSNYNRKTLSIKSTK
ncbi:predicted protein, partial [Nematostella vectensis]